MSHYVDIECVAVVFAAEGQVEHHDAEIGPTTTVKEFINIAVRKTGIEGCSRSTSRTPRSLSVTS